MGRDVQEAFKELSLHCIPRVVRVILTCVVIDAINRAAADYNLIIEPSWDNAMRSPR